MDKLYLMLSKSVTYVVLNSSSDTVHSSDYFNKVIELHNEQLKVPKSYVLAWRDSLLETIKELDTELSPNEYECWQQTIDIILEPIGI